MRVNPDSNSSMLAGLNRLTESAKVVLRQLSSGRTIQQPSDDPAGMASLVMMQASASSNTQYLSSVKSVRSQLQAADASLNSVVVALERAISLGVRGATGTLNDSNRESVAAELDGIRDQLFELANSSIQGIHLFGGTATINEPFLKNGNTITYQGTTSSNDVAIGEGYVLRVGLPGSQIFGDDVSGVFSTISALAQAVRTGVGVDAAIGSVTAARDNLSAARVTYGNSLRQMDKAEQVLNERKLQFAQQETEIAGADLAEVATRLASVQTSRNALLSAIANTTGDNLFNYLR